MSAPGACWHPSFLLLPPAAALCLYKATGNGVKNQLVGKFWLQKVTCCLAAAQQARLDFDSFNPKLTKAARLFFLIAFQCCLSPLGRMRCLNSSLLLSGKSSPPFGWQTYAVDRTCGAWFQRNPTRGFLGHRASVLEIRSGSETPLTSRAGHWPALAAHGHEPGWTWLKEDRQSHTEDQETLSYTFAENLCLSLCSSSLIINSAERKRLFICITKFFSHSNQPINRNPSIFLSINLHKPLCYCIRHDILKVSSP